MKHLVIFILADDMGLSDVGCYGLRLNDCSWNRPSVHMAATAFTFPKRLQSRPQPPTRANRPKTSRKANKKA